MTEKDTKAIEAIRKILEREANAKLASTAQCLFELGATSVNFRLDKLPLQAGAKLSHRLSVEVAI